MLLISGKTRQAVVDILNGILFITHFTSDQNIYYIVVVLYFLIPLTQKKTEQPSLLDEVVRTPNLNMEIVNQIESNCMYFNPEEFDGTTTVETNMFTPLNILDYTMRYYTVQHREKYKEFF
jgi:hypothetical protein